MTVHDASGNAVAGTAVTLSASGSSNSFGTISGTTNASGVFTTTLASTLAQNETITATEGSAQEHASVNFVAGAPSATTSSIVASSPTVTADGTSTTTLTVTVEDAHGNAVAGTAVTLSGSGSANSFGAISGTTDANGKFTTTLASALVQNETITASEGSAQEHTSVSFVAGALPDLTAAFDHVSNTTIAAGGSTSVDFWVVNFGNATAAASTSGLYLSTTPTITTADTLLTTVASPALTADGTAGYYDHQTVSLTLPGNLAPGTYYIGGIADYNNAVAESNQIGHNHDVTQITVPSAGAARSYGCFRSCEQHHDRGGWQHVG